MLKKYKFIKKVSRTLRCRIEKVIETNDKYKNCYFWNSNGSASGRRRAERIFSFTNPDFEIITKKGIIKISVSYSESCKNVYYNLHITFNGIKKDIRLLKKILN